MDSKTDNTYGCDVCAARFDWDTDIIWLTSSFGVCGNCYEQLSEAEKERITKEYE